mgnify:CR=1 FL=1
MKRHPTDIKSKIRKNTELTVFLDVITIKDEKIAYRWFKKSADQNNTFAQSNLGWLYLMGKGVEVDYKEAFKYSKLAADKFLDPKTLGILVLGFVAFGIGTATGVLMAKLMNKLSKHQINPLIGSAGVSAVPMAARVSNKVGLEANPQNFLLMHAMGPNVAGVIGSAIAAGVMISLVGVSY